ncbi:MAG: C1 family peptidase, partial [Bacteroidota bacterium]
MKNYRIWLLALAVVFMSSGCEDLDGDGTPDILQGENGLGWFGSENDAELEDDIVFSQAVDPASLPESVDLTEKFPPIGNQGQYGTCVSWAVGYNAKTYLHGQDLELSSADLASANNQFSPKDLFLALPNNLTGENCNSTSFEAALDVMVNRGVAKMSTDPYTDLGDCSQSPSSLAQQEADDFKFENYRQVDLSVDLLKFYLSNGRPVIFGAKLGDGFMNWNSGDVITSDGPMTNGQHGYHAMVLSGYDNGVGPRGAFRVVNTWDNTWGDNGYIWVDYDFFINDFAFSAFVAKNAPPPGYDPDADGDGNVDGDNIRPNSVDLVAWELQDVDAEDDDDTYRDIVYNVYNTGDQTIPAGSDYNILYIYYNAYDAEDFDILLYDYYSDDYGAPGENGDLTGTEDIGISGNWYNHVDIPGGRSLSGVVYDDNDERPFNWGYKMPSDVNGQYYLCLIADGFDDIEEFDEDNNFFYAQQPNGDPLEIVNGVIQTDFVGKNGGKGALGFRNLARP